MTLLRALLRWLNSYTRTTSRAAQRRKRKDERRAMACAAAENPFGLNLDLLLLIVLWSPDWP